MENHPDLWLSQFPRREGNKHKYDFGHAVIVGAPHMTGATRLAAEACARIGAGLTTVLADGEATSVYRSTLPAHIIVEDTEDNFYSHFEDERRNAVLIGPGAGKEYKALSELISKICKLDKQIVLDADALNAIAEAGSINVLNAFCVLTPHEGEFARLFPDIQGSKIEKAGEAARKSKAVILLKGSDTVIAAPDGRMVVGSNGPANLATAGTGDVLAGIITGLLAQNMPRFEAACAAVWVHSECARSFGPGLVASDLSGKIPQVLGDLII